MRTVHAPLLSSAKPLPDHRQMLARHLRNCLRSKPLADTLVGEELETARAVDTGPSKQATESRRSRGLFSRRVTPPDHVTL
jgi:hypothetical protein